MKFEHNFTVIQSPVRPANSIRASLSFNAFGIDQIINDCKVDTGCASTLIAASNINFAGMSLDEAQKYLLFRKDVNVTYGFGVEGRNIDRSNLVECLKKLHMIKTHCRKNNIDINKTKEIIKSKLTPDEIRTIMNSILTKYVMPIKEVTIASKVRARAYGIQVGFNISSDVNLIGMSILQNTYMETFSAYGNLYALITMPEKKYIDRVTNIGRQIREKPIQTSF